MVRRPHCATLNCESLEVRDVPAIILDASVNTVSMDRPPSNGVVSIAEVQIASNQIIFNRNGTIATNVTKIANASDTLTLTNNGNTLTITNSDGIFGRLTNANNALVTYGNTLTISGVTGLIVGLQLGGNDSITDSTSFATTIDAGPGDDQITGQGGVRFDTRLFQFALVNGVFNQRILAAIGGNANPKTLLGGTGNDTLTVLGSATGFTLDGGFGNDMINGPSSGLLNTFRGGDGADRITGPVFGFFNTYDGGAGNDTIQGSLGTDFITGGTGQDFLVGFGGRDFYYEIDVEPDFIANLPGDFAFGDPFDVRLTRK